MSMWFRQYGYAAVAPDLVIGAYLLDAEDVGTIEQLGVSRVLNLAEDLEYPPGTRDVVEHQLARAGIEEERFRLPDFGGLPTAAIDFLVAIVNRWLDEQLTTYVHCRAGWQRSASVAAAVLSVRQSLDVDAAVRAVQIAKPSAEPLPHQREDLRRWARTHQRLAEPAGS